MTAHDSTPEKLAATVEAVLFTTDSPLTAARISDITQVPSQAGIRNIIEQLNHRYEQTGASFRIKPIAGGFQMQTLPEYDEVLGRLHQSRKDTRLSQASIETLAIIAYRQPILRADVEAIRGVACGEVLRGLIDRQLVKVAGRADVLGRPMLYGTTKKFLEVFGLASIDDLPNAEELRLPTASPAPAASGGTPADTASAEP